MADIIPFKKPRLKDKYKGHSLCRNGLHRWILEKDSQFDVKQGRLVSVYRCSRCGETKTKPL